MTIDKICKRNTWRALATASFAGVLTDGGCNNGPKFADSKDAVNNSLTPNNLGRIHISQDRGKEVMTLTGTFSNSGQKSQAEDIAKQAAPLI